MASTGEKESCSVSSSSCPSIVEQVARLAAKTKQLVVPGIPELYHCEPDFDACGQCYVAFKNGTLHSVSSNVKQQLTKSIRVFSLLAVVIVLLPHR